MLTRREAKFYTWLRILAGLYMACLLSVGIAPTYLGQWTKPIVAASVPLAIAFIAVKVVSSLRVECLTRGMRRAADRAADEGDLSRARTLRQKISIIESAWKGGE